jgi:hypothetical protein
MSDLKKWMQQHGGVAGVRDLADHFCVSEATVRTWGWEHDVPRVGNALVFQLEDAEELEADLAETEEDDGLDAEEPEDEDSDEDDAEESEDDGEDD